MVPTLYQQLKSLRGETYNPGLESLITAAACAYIVRIEEARGPNRMGHANDATSAQRLNPAR